MPLACLYALAAFAIVGPAALVNAGAAPQPIDVGSQDPTIKYSPPNSWFYANATGGFSKVGGTGVLEFVLYNASQAQASWRTPNATESLEFWAFQRSDGGNASISFDGGPENVFDYYNQTSSGADGPVLVFSTANLSPQEHTVTIKNLFDSRGTLNRGYGQLNVDHFVIIPIDLSTLSTSSSSSTSTTPTSSLSPTSTQSHSTQSTTPTPKPAVSSDNHAGAIAGGVVGGVAGLALVAAGLFLLMRWDRKRASARSAPLMAQGAGYPGSATTAATPELWNAAPPPAGGSAQPIGALYNPNDPSTFPPPPTPGPPTTQSATYTQHTPEL